MGQCLSFLQQFLLSSSDLMERSGEGSTDNSTREASELSTVTQHHSIDSSMSAPSITITSDLKNEVRGTGLALADVPVEQDRTYWEWQIKMAIPNMSSKLEVMFGVSNKRNKKFYEILAESTIPSSKHGTKFMYSLPNLKDGDVVGVLIQQSEVPMIQLYLNGDLIGQISKFRGTVFPSIYLPPGSASATFLYSTDQFVNGPPRPGFEPIMAERSIM